MLSLSEISPLLQVIFLDLMLPGDNAIVVAMAVVGLPNGQRVHGLTESDSWDWL
jgi:predicted tellurium resistance membrane protein TerC